MICAGVTGLVGVLLLAFGPAPGDAAVHLYRTLLVQHGAVLWDNFWYAGQYPIADYSLVYYLPAALVGNAPLVFGAAVVSTFLFAADRAGGVGRGGAVADPDLRGLRCGAALHRAV